MISFKEHKFGLRNCFSNPFRMAFPNHVLCSGKNKRLCLNHSQVFFADAEVVYHKPQNFRIPLCFRVFEAGCDCIAKGYWNLHGTLHGFRCNACSAEDEPVYPCWIFCGKEDCCVCSVGKSDDVCFFDFLFVKESEQVFCKLRKRQRLCSAGGFSVSAGIYCKYLEVGGKIVSLVFKVSAFSAVSVEKNKRFSAA